MRYSLLSRFQGGLVAAIIAEKLAIKENIGSNLAPMGYSREILNFTTSLIESPHLTINPYFQNALNTRHDTVSMITVIPLIFLNHENFSNLEDNLTQFGDILNYNPQTISDMLIWSYLITLILREKLYLPQYLEQLQQQLSHLETPLLLELEKIRDYLNQGVSLKQLTTKLTHLSNFSQNLATAIYCFLRTPQDISLSVFSALQTKQQQPLTTILTAVLAGVYNSNSGIPLTWRWSVANDSLIKQAYEQTNYLFQLWSGCYHPQQPILADNLVIASPQVIQPRTIWGKKNMGN